MLAAILLCGSVVTFVACRGNSLEDIIGNSDNTVPADLIKELLGALDDNAEITFDIKYNGNAWHPVLKKDGDVFVLQNPSDNPDIPSNSYHLNPTLTYDVATKHIVLSVFDSYTDDLTPYIGIIFDVEKNTYAVVNYNANIDFLGITIKNNEGKSVEKIKNGLANKATVLNSDGTDELFYVYYNDGEKWDDIYNRYKEAFGTYCPIQAKAADDSELKYKKSYASATWYRLTYENNGDAHVKYNEEVGKDSEGTNNCDKYKQGNV